jgi:phosphoheptose isomerase
MSLEPIQTVQAILRESAAAHERFATTGASSVATAADAIRAAVVTGGKVLAFGNGGSASDAEHLVAELVGRFEGERRPLPAVALTANSSVVTAISNDYGYEPLFVRQVQALGAPGDVAVGISTSGKSRNVEAALDAAKAIGMVTIALTGRDGGPMGIRADIHVNVPEQATPRIQEVHRTVMHAMCSLVDRALLVEKATL